MIWALADSGSAAHVARASKHFPGALVQESDAQRRGVQYVGATGDQTPNLGEMHIQFWTPDGQQRVTTFQNAAVGMPILSIGLITDEGNDVTFTKNGGYILQKDTGFKTQMVRRLGVYFVQLRVPRKFVDPGFGRPDA